MRGFGDGLTDVETDGQRDICNSRVVFGTEKRKVILFSFTSLFCNSQETFKQELKCQTLLVLTCQTKYDNQNK